MKIVKSLKDNKGCLFSSCIHRIRSSLLETCKCKRCFSGYRDTGPKEIIRATIESVAYQTYDLFEAMKHDGKDQNLLKLTEEW